MNAKQTVNLRMQRIVEVDGGMLIHPVGRIDIYNTEGFRQQVMEVMDQGFTKLVFDCAEVPYMSSAAVGTCANLMVQAKKRNGNLAMANVAKLVRDVISLLGMTLYLNLMDSTAEAVQFIASPGQAPASFPRIFGCPVCGHRLRVRSAGCFRCSECKTVLRVPEEGAARPVNAQEDNDYELIPARTEKALQLLGELSQRVRRSAIDPSEKAAFKRTLGQIVVNLYQREVKDVWAELEEVR